MLQERIAARGAGTTAGAPGAHHHQSGLGLLALGALGVVYGDIGTSPLYSLQTVFTIHNGEIKPTQTNVYGIVSMVFWSLMLVVTVKYVICVMQADNDGEGGIMALIALIRRTSHKTMFFSVAALAAAGVFGASLFFGDAMITPAISVLSAVEGLNVVSSSLTSLVLPISLSVLALLFLLQKFGTGAVGTLFGPVMVIWFAAIATAGVAELSVHPGALASLSPTYAVRFAAEHPGLAFLGLSGVVLTITGVEALYADMGHFGRKAISRAWLLVVFPALTLNYMGQGAVMLAKHSTVSNPFFFLLPAWSRIPMVILATVATVIASQAVISGAFSLARQAVQLGYLPRILIRHTSGKEVGQVYSPAINWGLFVAVVVLILGFRHSANLATAYGVAVTGTITITTFLFLSVAHARWNLAVWKVVALGTVFLTVDLLFFSANVDKLATGGWFPVTIAIAVFTVFMTWSKGAAIVTRVRTKDEGPLRKFIEDLRVMDPPVHRVPGTAVFLNANPETTPLALRANVEHNHALHESVVIVYTATQNVPIIPESERIIVDDLGYVDDGIVHIGGRYGFMESVDIPRLVAVAAASGQLEVEIDLKNASYFISRINLRRGNDKSMAKWRKMLFLNVARHASNPVEYFNLPYDRTVVMGGHVTI
jgi:KUP system potassium uptake protein